ncbi:MAG: SDR family NAD(P)-dependent oxidoreductase [Pseudomonadota bacterium]
MALVSGASRGFGRAVARQLGTAGATVIAVARTVGGLEELDDEVRRAGGPAPVLVPLDLTDGDGVDRMGAALFERFGRIDLAVHAAAQGQPLMPIAEVRPKDFAKAAACHLEATWRLIRSLDPLLRASASGTLVHIDDAKADQKFWGLYGSTKAAATHLVRSYAAETPALRVLIHEPPAMPTALRARTHPGEDKSQLTSPDAAAKALLLEIDRRVPA